MTANFSLMKVMKFNCILPCAQDPFSGKTGLGTLPLFPLRYERIHAFSLIQSSQRIVIFVSEEATDGGKNARVTASGGSLSKLCSV